MANSDTPFGLKPIKHFSGAPWNGKANVYYVPSSDSTALFVGDAVKLGGSADATGKYPSIAQATAGDAIVGVVIGFGDNPYTMINPDSPNTNYRVASTEMYCLVVDDPQVIFEVQEDSGGAALAVTAVGQGVDLVVGSGSTTTGKSGMELDSSSATTSGQCKLMRLVNREDNVLGDNAKWEVLIAEHQYLNSVGTGV